MIPFKSFCHPLFLFLIISFDLVLSDVNNLVYLPWSDIYFFDPFPTPLSLSIRLIISFLVFFFISSIIHRFAYFLLFLPRLPQLFLSFKPLFHPLSLPFPSYSCLIPFISSFTRLLFNFSFIIAFEIAASSLLFIYLHSPSLFSFAFPFSPSSLTFISYLSFVFVTKCQPSHVIYPLISSTFLSFLLYCSSSSTYVSKHASPFPFSSSQPQERCHILLRSSINSLFHALSFPAPSTPFTA